jgi:S-formylglutathione hydrolase FrmB
MKKLIVISGLCLFVMVFLSLAETQIAYPQTDIPAGDVSGTWTLSNSPYHINGEITIPDSQTLIIEPGVEVIFTGHYKFNVQGRILAIGTEQDSIIFTADDHSAGWHGFKFDNTPSSNDSSIIEYCRLEYGKANTGSGDVNLAGGAIYAKLNKLRISNSLFRNNMCYHSDITQSGGGAIYIEGDPIIEFCEFNENSGVFGGAMLIWGSGLNPVIRNNYFHHNQGHGTINVGSWSGNNASPLFINNVIINNNSNGHGIVHFSHGTGLAVLINNTIAYNNTSGQGGAVFTNHGVAPLLINTIIYGNKPAQIRLEASSGLDFINCLIEGGEEGFSGASFTGIYQNNIDNDPLFVDAANNDFHLIDISPCIGAGADSVEIDGTWYYAPSADLDDNLRPNPAGSNPDIGALESKLGNPFHTDIPGGDVSGTWSLLNSPYHINGEITIPNGETLTIEPGVEVVFLGNYKFNVQGRILAIGTESDTIVFTINDTTGFHNLTIPDGGWGGIRFIDTPSNNDSSKIIYCKLQCGKANTGEGFYDRWGGALCAKINKLLVSHCLFRNNTCYKTIINETGGGAIAIVGNPIIEFCEFSENTSSFGGAMLIWGSDLYPLIRNNYLHHNQGHGTINIGSWGGSNTSPVLINNIIANNNSNGLFDANGHGIVHISNGGGNTVLINNTIVNNNCTGSGGAVFTNYKAATSLLINNIIYGNEPSQVNLLTPSSLSFLNCLVEGGKEGFTGSTFTGTYQYNIDCDPMFVDAANNDFHLMDSSPCISYGADSVEIDGSWYYAPSADFAGNLRPNPAGSSPDIGALESKLGNPLTRIIEDQITSPSLEGNLLGDPATRKMRIYLPPSYDQGGNFPVVYLLHALPVGETAYLIEENWLDWVGVLWSAGPDFPENGLEGMLDDLIAKGKMKEMIIVMPDASCKYVLSWYTNSVLNGNYEDYIVNDLVSYIDSHYRTIPNRDNRAMVGFCMGGYGAIKLAMKHQDVFGAAACHSGPLYFEGLKAFIPAAIAENPDGMIGPHPEKPVTNLIYAGSATFSPNLNNPPFFLDLPFEYPSGTIIDSVWNRWLEHDPFTMLSIYGSDLASLRGVYFDCGDQDEFGFNHHADAFHQALAAASIEHEYEIFAGGTHCNKLYSRLVISLSFISDAFVTGVEQKGKAEVPLAFSLSQNYPNPFNPQTRIKYQLPHAGKVVLKVYNIVGQEICTLVDEVKPAGSFEVLWDGRDNTGHRVASGVYLYRIEAQSFVQTRKMLLLQ